MPTVERAGATIHYELSGQGHAIVFAHRFLCDESMFAHQVAALQPRWRVINVNLRGSGRSSAALSPLDFYDFADDVLAVLDAEGVAQAVWAGLSTGGFTALRAALTRPERVRALVLMDTDAGASPFALRVRDRLMRGVARAFGPAAVIAPMMSIMFGRTTRREQPALCEDYRRRFLAVPLPSILGIGRAITARDDLLPRLAQIHCPTLVLVGEEDKALPVALSRRLAAGIRGAELVVVPHAGHLSALEAPAAVTQAIERSLAPLEERHGRTRVPLVGRRRHRRRLEEYSRRRAIRLRNRPLQHEPLPLAATREARASPVRRGSHGRPSIVTDQPIATVTPEHRPCRAPARGHSP